MTKQEKITRVFTKYDAVPCTIRTNQIKGGTIVVVDYKAVSIEEGLEGVKFVHYEK